MRAFTSLLSSLFAVLVIVTSAAAQSAGSIAVAADDDCIAVYSEHVERRLLRVHFDQAAGKAAFSPFGPTGIETFAVAPKGAFVVYAAIPDGGPVTMTDDWVMVYRASDGAIQRVVDLKTLNRDLTPAGRETEGLFRLK